MKGRVIVLGSTRGREAAALVVDGQLTDLLVEGGDRSYLIGGDLVFYGGKIVNQYIWDNSIQDYGKSMIRMADVEFDALLPGHWTISMRNGSRHVKKAAETFRNVGMPPNGI